jgi:electron transport complex protein RnfG
VGKNPGKVNFTVSKDGGDIDAITASTITSRAFLLAIKNAYDNVCVTDANTGATTQAKKLRERRNNYEQVLKDI